MTMTEIIRRTTPISDVIHRHQSTEVMREYFDENMNDIITTGTIAEMLTDDHN